MTSQRGDVPHAIKTIFERDRELATYNQNTPLRQQNAELTARFQTKVDELRVYKEREHDLSQVLQNIALELP